MGKAKKLKLLRRAIREQATKAGVPKEIPFAALNPHYKRMKKIILGKGGDSHVAHPLH